MWMGYVGVTEKGIGVLFPSQVPSPPPNLYAGPYKLGMGDNKKSIDSEVSILQKFRFRSEYRIERKSNDSEVSILQKFRFRSEDRIERKRIDTKVPMLPILFMGGERGDKERKRVRTFCLSLLLQESESKIDSIEYLVSISGIYCSKSARAYYS